MKLQELSIGNWVYNKHHGKAIQITPFDFFTHTHNKEEKQCLAGNPDFVSGKDFEPIPITPEILEKNGWKFHTAMSDYVLAEDYYSIIVNEVTDGLYQFKIVGEEIINTTEIIHASYVHQLQNALTLCGIDKEIVL